MHFSIVIPFKDTYINLKECIKSISNQTFSDYEIIIINDGSSTKEVKKIKELKNNFTLITNKKNMGVSYSRNRGIKKAKGSYIVFLDSDDLISPNFLLNIYIKLKAKKYDFLYVDSLDLIGNKKQNNYVKNNPRNKNFLGSITNLNKFKIQAWNYIVKSKIIKKNLFLPKLKFFEDQIFVSKLFFGSYSFSIVKNSFYIRRNDNIESLGRTIGKEVIDLSLFAIKYFQNLKFNSIIEQKFINSRINFYLKGIYKNLFFVKLKDKEKLKSKLLYVFRKNKHGMQIKNKFDLINLYKRKIKEDKFKIAVIYCTGQLGKIIYKQIIQKYSKIFLIDNNPGFKNKKFEKNKIYSEDDFVKKYNFTQKFTLYICNENKQIQKKILKNFRKRKIIFNYISINFF